MPLAAHSLGYMLILRKAGDGVQLVDVDLARITAARKSPPAPCLRNPTRQRPRTARSWMTPSCLCGQIGWDVAGRKRCTMYLAR